MTTLVVTQPFGDYAVGQEITAPEAVETALETNPGSVVRRAEVDTPEPAAKPSKADKA